MSHNGRWARVARVADCLTMAVASIWIFIFACFVIGLGWDMNKSELSGWVQAIGSVGAILGAIWIWRRQHKADEARLNAREVIWNAAVRADISSVIKHLDMIVGGTSPLADFSAQGLVNWKQVREIHTKVLEDVEAIDASKAGGVDVVEKLGQLKRKMRSAGIFLAMISEAPTHTTLVNMMEGELRDGLGVARELDTVLNGA